MKPRLEGRQNQVTGAARVAAFFGSHELQRAVRTRPPVRDPDLKGGEDGRRGDRAPLPRSGKFADVYQVRGG